MRILVINGSPRGEKSNTYRLTKAFLEGLGEGREEPLEIEEIMVNRLDIHTCLGCFSCWNKTPGNCCIRDDMEHVIQKLLWAQVTIWSFPLYYFTVPGGLKNLIDRQLPMVLPFMEEDETKTGSGSHPARWNMEGKKTVVISTCGFYTAQGNYDGVRSLFDHICGRGGYDAIFCGQGELFRVPELSKRTDEYLSYVKKAGAEYGKGGILPETRAELEKLLYPRHVFEAMADASWGISRETGENESETLVFTRQMAALYRRESYPGHDLVLEMWYTDVDERYQIVLGREGSRVLTSDFLGATTRIETSFSLWRSIAAGEIRGDEALMRRLYKVKGDLGLMISWDDYFGTPGGRESREKENRESMSGKEGKSIRGGEGDGGLHVPVRETDMKIMLLPWMAFWIAASVDRWAGSLIAVCVCAAAPLLFFRHKKTLYDSLSGALVGGFSAAMILGVPDRAVMSLSYLAFGVMWLMTCFGKIPLTAHYSMNGYGGEKALNNPLFLKTNRILTMGWGILYVFTSVWTYALMGTGLKPYMGAVNSAAPCVMGVFTAWFQKWYPARVAGGR